MHSPLWLLVFFMDSKGEGTHQMDSTLYQGEDNRVTVTYVTPTLLAFLSAIVEG